MGVDRLDCSIETRQVDLAVLDLAAGAGGKSLALAAAMKNQGEIIASDIRGPASLPTTCRLTRKFPCKP